MVSDYPARRPLRSFVRREGRITSAQKRALQQEWPCYGIEQGSEPLNWKALFRRSAPVFCEIGFGNGDALIHMALQFPEVDFVGIEVYRPGLGALLLKLKQHQLENVRVTGEDAVVFLNNRVAHASLDKLFIFFPDPWPKKRHHKRRLIQKEFVELAVSRLTDNGVIHCATDWQDYAEYMLEVLGNESELRNQSKEGGYSSRPQYRMQTKYERRGYRLGHQSWDLVFYKQE